MIQLDCSIFGEMRISDKEILFSSSYKILRIKDIGQDLSHMVMNHSSLHCYKRSIIRIPMRIHQNIIIRIPLQAIRTPNFTSRALEKKQGCIFKQLHLEFCSCFKKPLIRASKSSRRRNDWQGALSERDHHRAVTALSPSGGAGISACCSFLSLRSHCAPRLMPLMAF